jgi:microcystin-dependent protein
MDSPFLGTIIAVGYNFTPRGWLDCNGQLLSITSNQALFALLGTSFGGDGRVTFGIPDLRGRVPMGMGTGNGLPQVALGQIQGVEGVGLSLSEIPAHTHTGATINATAQRGTSSNPSNTLVIATASDDDGNNYNIYGPSDNVTHISATTTVAGSSQPHNNMQPYLVCNYIIATSGLFPSRN